MCECGLDSDMLSPHEGDVVPKNATFFYLGPPGKVLTLRDAAGAELPITTEVTERPNADRALFVSRPGAPLEPGATYTLDDGFWIASFVAGAAEDRIRPLPPVALDAAAFGVFVEDPMLGCWSQLNFDLDILALAFAQPDVDVRMTTVALRRPDEALPFDVLYVPRPFTWWHFYSDGVCVGDRAPVLADGESLCLSVTHWDLGGNASAPSEICVTKERTCTMIEDVGFDCPWPQARAESTSDGGCSVTPGSTADPTLIAVVAASLLLARRVFRSSARASR